MNIADYIFLVQEHTKSNDQEKTTYHGYADVNRLKPGEEVLFLPLHRGGPLIKCKEVGETEVVLEFDYKGDPCRIKHTIEVVLSLDNPIGVNLYHGKDFDRESKIMMLDPKEAAQCEIMQQANEDAQAGNAQALYFIGLSYYHGWNGIEQDKEKGTQLIRKAAEGGCTDAMEDLGKYILRYNDYEAYEWLKKAGCDYEADELMRIHQMMQ